MLQPIDLTETIAVASIMPSYNFSTIQYPYVNSSNSCCIKGKNSNDEARVIDHQYIIRAAQVRWLTPTEIEAILLHHDILGLQVSDTSPDNPSNGNIYLFDRNATKLFKHDGISWSKKKGSERTQETYQQIKIDGVDRMVGIYSKAAEDSSFRKRIYKLQSEDSNLVFVHYRVCIKQDPEVLKQNKKDLSRSNHTMKNGGFINGPNSMIIDRDPHDLLDDEDCLAELLLWNDNQTDEPTSNDTRDSCNNTLVYHPIATIIDFSPAKDTLLGGEKVIICLNSDEVIKTFKSDIFISFGGTTVRAEELGPTVLRCIAPPHIPGNCSLVITTGSGQVLSPPTEQQFTFVPINTGSSSSMKLNNPSMSLSPPRSYSHKRLHNGDNADGFNNVSSSLELEHKIRIVEKLGTVNTALQLPDSNMVNASVTPGILPPTVEGMFALPDSEYEWIDDYELSQLSPTDLEKLMDRYLMSVVQQLVQLASLDDELKAELDALDANGFSLLHYCCMYNVNTLVPVLLARGASVDQQSTDGSTSLHLAAAHGVLPVAQILIEHGADLNKLDNYGRSPYDNALLGGHHHVVDYLIQCARKTNPNAISDVSYRTLSSVHINTNIGYIDKNNSFSPTSSSQNSYIMSDNQPDPALLNSSLNSSRGSTSLLHDAFLSLSLADKCAFSLSLNSNTMQDGMSQLDTSDGNIMDSSHVSEVSMPNYPSLEDLESFEIRSVLSESEKESLDVAMSMMALSEIQKLEDEARRIQNNVRGWLLRKNFVNLRDAAITLQGAWRDKRRSSDGDNKKIADTNVNYTSQTTMEQVNTDTIQLQNHAAATLQAATRRFFAQKAFSRTRHQTIASLIIQKNLHKWWANNANNVKK